ncbi:uncharacterized protein LOC144565601 [Carex rostrata]
MALARSSVIRRLHKSIQPSYLFSRFGAPSNQMPLDWSCRGFGKERGLMSSSYKIHDFLSQNVHNSMPVYTVKMLQMAMQLNSLRSMSVKVPGSTKKSTLKIVMQSPGFVYEPYEPRERISFWKRWFTPIGWRRTKEDLIMEMKSAYAINKLRKTTGYTKKSFYQQAVRLYKEINTLMANGDLSALRKVVTEKMYSTLKNELKKREAVWSSVYWELEGSGLRLRTLRARMIAIDKNDLDKAYIQLTIEFVGKQKFEAYNKKGEVVSGDKTKQVLVKDIWVFERSLFHPGADWRLCGRLS